MRKILIAVATLIITLTALPVNAATIKFQTIVNSDAPGYGAGATRSESERKAIISCKNNKMNKSKGAQKLCSTKRMRFTLPAEIYMVAVSCKYKKDGRTLVTNQLGGSDASFNDAFKATKKQMGARSNWRCKTTLKLRGGKKR